MGSSEASDNQFNKFTSKAVQRFDQELQELRATYISMSDSERKNFRMWMHELADAVGKRPIRPPRISVLVLIDNSIEDENGNTLYDGSARLSPVVIRDAICAWDNGEEYAPSLAGFCR